MASKGWRAFRCFNGHQETTVWVHERFMPQVEKMIDRVKEPLSSE